MIAIIAILAAILFPVFAQAREKARQTSCASNLKQLATAFMAYAQDYDETFPRNHHSSVAGIPNSGRIEFPPGSGIWRWHEWWFQVEPYVKNWQIF